MGVGQSTEDGARASSPEELSYLLAERFATKCFTPLELTHLKDNFFSRAIDQSGLKYWNENILSDFLGIPDGSDRPGKSPTPCPVDAGPVVFRMVSYLGAFPFQNTLAPCVLTFDAMVKVVVLLTERYGKVLRRGHRDRVKLLFGSLADVGRRESAQSAGEQASTQLADDVVPASDQPTSATGFAIDQPTNDDDYEEDDEDDLALAALESLDAIEVFRHDQRIDKTVFEARISRNTFRRLLMLLLVIAPLEPLQSVSKYTVDLNADRMDRLRRQAESILASFGDDDNAKGISYGTFARTVSSSLPFLFDPLTPLFEHMLFSCNLDLSKKRHGPDLETPATPETDEKQSEDAPLSIDPIFLSGSFESAILHDSVLAHISFFLPTSPSVPNLFRSKVRLHPIFSTAAHGSSLTSFSHHVLTWQSSTLLILHGARDAKSSREGDEDASIVLGAYLPSPWKSLSPTSSSVLPPKDADIASLPCLFQLFPKHILLPCNPSASSQIPNTPAAHFSTHTGLAVGCEIPPSSRSTHPPPRPHGAGSLTIDTSLESAEFHISPNRHDGAFLPPAGSGKPATASDKSTKTNIDIYTLEVWGLVQQEDHGESASSLTSATAATASSYVPRAVALQREKWNFEAREAERRKNVNLNVGGGGESAVANARWLLETAGLIGENSGSGRAGGSV